MSIRHALPADVDTLADIEAASYPSAEGASRQSIAGRVAVYPDCFWLLDEGGEVKAFVNGFVTDMPDLTDEMYDDPHLHTPKGGWQMIFSVVTAPAHRHEAAPPVFCIRSAPTRKPPGARASCSPAKNGSSAFMHSSASWMRAFPSPPTAMSSGIRCG